MRNSSASVRLKTILKRILSKRCIEKINDIFRDIYATKSYSQEGEDMILRQIFTRYKMGFYVDIGAHHPKRYSNTFFFYKKGWNGINIDAMPGSMKLFNKIRPRDLNLEIAVSDKKESLIYYAFNDPALNTFCKDLSRQRNGHQHYKILFEKEIKTVPLSDILHQHVPRNKEITFLSIDVEGLDLAVLKSNNWEKYKPKVIIVESPCFSLDDAKKSDIYTYLSGKSYKLSAKTVNSLIFMRSDFDREATHPNG